MRQFGGSCVAVQHSSKGLSMPDNRKAILYRMVLPNHTCAFGVRAKELLEAQGYEIEEHILSSREEVDAFQAEHGVSTTPQVFIDGERIGGSEELESYLERERA
jgi:glutaredoxin 3